MGLGKTIQTIALLMHLYQSSLSEAKHSSVAVGAAYSKSSDQTNRHPLFGPHLIVVPLSTIGDWVAAFKKWCPPGDDGSADDAIEVLQHNAQTVTTTSGVERPANPEERCQWLADLRREWNRSKKNGTPPPFHVMITTFDLAIRDESELSRFKWSYLIVDEAHRLKNSSSRLVQTLETSVSPSFVNRSARVTHIVRCVVRCVLCVAIQNDE